MCSTCYYLLLNKIANNEKDLCVSCVSSNRYRSEIESLIGNTANTVPYYFKLNPEKTFEQLLKQVKHLCLDIMNYSYLPYSEILKLYAHQRTSAIFLPYVDATLSFETTLDNNIYLNDQTSMSKLIDQKSLNLIRQSVKFDFTLIINYDTEEQKLHYSFNYSHDVFNHSTIEIISQRFEQLVEQLFNSLFNKQTQPIYELSLILPFERQLLYDINQTHVDYGRDQLKCIHHLFVDRVLDYSQKVSVILDEQSLTYSELLYYVQLVSVQLIQVHHVRPQQIICQCLERSIEMSIGILSIITCGAIYAPFNPQDPSARLQSLLQDSQSNHIIVHQFTKEKFCINEAVVDLININQIISQAGDSIEYRDFNYLSSVQTNIDKIAYVLFTSGSTGIPKAVSI
ncbi:unnamed protein product [Didymodactylos carnosus]|uniref:Uncharacterized protein n=1 Tax=Didymodactylos carnosus TaxID=1234261 RepID=A0A8S2EKE2_9BILA|nr:unnamed protein product [Didymodactylos carnosus]CAF3982811.1 unnamed protein product [Didymodactylos carnosus]